VVVKLHHLFFILFLKIQRWHIRDGCAVIPTMQKEDGHVRGASSFATLIKKKKMDTISHRVN
jgi:diketogulonate reductase-like aldo/keto reductase